MGVKSRRKKERRLINSSREAELNRPMEAVLDEAAAALPRFRRLKTNPPGYFKINRTGQWQCKPCKAIHERHVTRCPCVQERRFKSLQDGFVAAGHGLAEAARKAMEALQVFGKSAAPAEDPQE
jgi:hypothetical protein